MNRASRRIGRLAALAVATAVGVAACAGPGDGGTLPPLAPLVQRASSAVVGIAAAESGSAVLGSGFRVENTRYVATAAHVVNALKAPPAIVWNAQRWSARVSRIDDDVDLALLEIDAAAPMPGLALADDAPAPAGTWVLVLGCPFGTLPTATLGIVSAPPGAVMRPPALASRMQLNAAVNPGNSGGPVIGLDARVLGVANASVPGGYGLGFAVPVAALRRMLQAGDAAPAASAAPAPLSRTMATR